jgi:uncharacterized membrane protein YfcA
MPAAVAAVTLPHAAATALRCWRLRGAIDWPVLRRFGLPSAAGGLAGALLHGRLGGSTLTAVLGALLVLTALANLSGLASRWHPHGAMVPLLGFLSGGFGGVAGNQGGLRAAALAAFPLGPAAFVATATATGLIVDAARLPVYVWQTPATFRTLVAPIGALTVGVVAGTLLGERALLGIPPARFRQVVAGAIGVLGIWLLATVLT